MMKTDGHWACLAALLTLAVPAHASFAGLEVLDEATGHPIAGASVTVGDQVARTDADGRVSLAEPAQSLGVRAPGYGRQALQDDSPTPSQPSVRLAPFHAKALYLSYYGIGSQALRGAALKLIGSTELNALVIDVKGDRGRIPYRSTVPLAVGSGAQQGITVRDMSALIAQLHGRGVYLIARVVSFKDDPLARAHPEWAVHGADGGLYIDREGLAWTDPFRPEVRGYVLDVAEEAARLGFDEIQFDYVRLPDHPGLVFARRSSQANRVEAISGFLAEARHRLAPYNVFIAADIFGYVLWNLDDTGIGQRLDALVKNLDYVSPMLYPSGFQFGIPGYKDPVAVPREIVELSLRNALRRTGVPGLRFRPWLQAFRDYAFDRRTFGAEQIRAQIDGAEAVGSSGWMLWNPHNTYSEAGLKAGGQP